jgi:predicted CoA-binding protein
MSKTVAIVGASANRRKFGNKAVRAFLDAGWTVYPVNPMAKEIEGLASYPSVAEVPEPLDCVSMYVSPAIGITMLDAIAAKKPGKVYLNPGAEDDALIARAQALGIPAIATCSILDIGRRPGMYPDA